MPTPVVFACPSCGASLSVDEGAATTRCQFCYNTVIVPEELRGRKEPEAAGLGNVAGAVQGQPLKELGNLVRAGNKLAAIKLYRELFGSGLAEAQSAVDKLSLGQGVQVVYMGMPTTLLVDRSPAASFSASPVVSSMGQPMAPIQPVQPVIITGNPGRSLGCVIWGVVLTTFLGIALAFLITGGAMLPLLAGLFGDGGLGEQFGDILTNVPGVSATAAQVADDRDPTATPEATPGFATPLLTFGSAGTGAGAFNDARHLGVDGDGNIYVGEWTDHRIQVFDAEGDFVTQWFAGQDDAILTAMAVTPEGTVFAIAGSQLYLYDGATGEQLNQVEYADEPFGFEDVAVTPDGGIVVAYGRGAGDDILRFDRDLALDLEIPAAISTVTGDSELDMHLAVDGNGKIYVLGTFSEAIFRFSPEGVFQNQFGSDGSEPGQFTAPSEIAVDRQSRLYITDFKGIQVFDANGRYLDVFDVPDGGFVHGLVVDSDNFLYAVSNNGKVYKFAINE